MSQALRNQIELTISLSDEEFEFVLSHFTHKHYRRHQFLVQEGHLVLHTWFILQGLTKSFYTDETGKEHIIHFAMDNGWTTDTTAFHQHINSSLNIYCLENCETLSITYENMEKLCAQLDKMQYYFRKKTIEENIQFQRRTQCLLAYDATNRYHELITNYPALINRVPKKMIASYLGVSRETLSRLLQTNR
jgi:CRP-like cAMP-binding protein